MSKGLVYLPNYIKPTEKAEILRYLRTLHPIWEMRFSRHHPPPEGENNRSLLRPVYWLGNWQFACLDYYRPPKGLFNRCLKAEPFPPVLERIIAAVESLARESFLSKDVPRDWHLNTCLINYYGSKIEADGRLEDVARVGEHKDFEPGPVASISFGEKALFQFVESRSKQSDSKVFLQQWLEDSSLQLFAGDKFKKQLFHRVQRVEKKLAPLDGLNTTGFETRRINFTFRYVPTDHIQPFHRFPASDQEDILPYMQELARHSRYFADALAPL
jgi:alkylated DNA repair protein (DNA oxidative demethylase)